MYDYIQCDNQRVMYSVRRRMFHHAGGVAGLVLCLFAKYNKRWQDWQWQNSLELELYHVHKWWWCCRRRGREPQVGSAQLESPTYAMILHCFCGYVLMCVLALHAMCCALLC